MFHVLQLEQNTTKKGRMNKFAISEFDEGNDKEYKVEVI